MLRPGINLVNPCSEEVHTIDMRLRVVSAHRVECITSDNVKLTLDGTVVSYRVTNPLVAKYKATGNLDRAIANLAVSSIRSTIGMCTLE